MQFIDSQAEDFSPEEFALFLHLFHAGYRHIRIIDGKFYGIHRMIYTVGVFCDLDRDFVNNGRICFGTHQEAVDFLAQWDGIADPAPFYPKADKRMRK